MDYACKKKKLQYCSILVSTKIESSYVSLLNIKKIKFNIYMISKLMNIFRTIFKLDL